MLINKKIMILVGEPWDFTSPEGENKFSGTVVEKAIFSGSGKRRPQFEDAFLIKVSVPFEYQDFIVSYVVATSRYVGNTDHFNFSYIPDKYVPQFIYLDNIIDNLKFIFIGSTHVA